jgi:hypothetical protein
MTGPVLQLLAAVVLVSIIVSILIALAAIQLARYPMLGPPLAGLIGAAACFALAYLAFFLLDPDPMSEFDARVPLYLRTLPITGFSAFFWLPTYMVVFSKLRRRTMT